MAAILAARADVEICIEPIALSLINGAVDPTILESVNRRGDAATWHVG
jgi:hypothetical protein